MTTPHTRKVLQLYCRLLRLHQLLPGNMGYIGGQFVKDEFRRHKTAGPEYVVSFMKEWTVSGTSLVCVEATGSLVCGSYRQPGVHGSHRLPGVCGSYRLPGF